MCLCRRTALTKQVDVVPRHALEARRVCVLDLTPVCCDVGPVNFAVHRTKIDEVVAAKVEARRAARLPVTRSTIQDLAREARDELKQKATSNATVARLDAFAVSQNWVSGFCKRQKLLSPRLHEEAGGVDAAAIAERMDSNDHGIEGMGCEGAAGDSESEEDHHGGPADPPDPPTPPSFAEVAKLRWDEVEAIATRFDMAEVMRYLSRLKLAWGRSSEGDHAQRTADGDAPPR